MISILIHWTTWHHLFLIDLVSQNGTKGLREVALKHQYLEFLKYL